MTRTHLVLKQQGMLILIESRDGSSVSAPSVDTEIGADENLEEFVESLGIRLFGWHISYRGQLHVEMPDGSQEAVFLADFNADHRSTGEVDENRIRRAWPSMLETAALTGVLSEVPLDF